MISASARCPILFVAAVLCITLSVCQTDEKTVTEAPTTETAAASDGLQLQDVVFVVLSQTNSYHVKRAEAFQEHFNKQLEGLEQSQRPQLYLTHEKWNFIGGWTVMRLIPLFAEEFKSKSWVFICEEETRIDLQKLVLTLSRYDHSKEYFLGKGLRDNIPTIIHHFAFANKLHEFPYPDFAAGVALSNALFVKYNKEFEKLRTDFSIDPKHELALFFYKEGKGVKLTEVPELCTNKITDKCATTYPVSFPNCGKAISEDDLFVGVKTCEKFHTTRVPVVKETWGQDAKHIEYYSEKKDPSIPTIDLGIPNTERGHCGKTMAMLKRWHQNSEIKTKSWYLIADDDTIIHLKRLRQLLACYDPNEAVHLGEQYGYGVMKNDHGYNYITGGGGMIFSREAINEMARLDQLNCFTDDAPDDMTLGLVFKRMGISLVHSPYFHQARPEDYSPDFLAPKTALSFHKHWEVDPYTVYQHLVSLKSHEDETELRKDSHEEL